MRLDRRTYLTRGRSRRASIRETIDRLGAAAPTTARVSPAAPLSALLLGRNPEPPPAPEDEDQTRCGYCGGTQCTHCCDAVVAGGA
jgi:hypothetical protein